MLLVSVWARFKPAHMFSCRLRANSRCESPAQVMACHAIHVYGHTGNLGNECLDHAAAFGTLGQVSSPNLSAHWARHNLDTAVCLVLATT